MLAVRSSLDEASRLCARKGSVSDIRNCHTFSRPAQASSGKVTPSYGWDRTE